MQKSMEVDDYPHAIPQATGKKDIPITIPNFKNSPDSPRTVVHSIFGSNSDNHFPDIGYSKPIQDYLVKCTLTNFTYNFITSSQESQPETEPSLTAKPYVQLLNTDA